jgi:hypothetical protein
MLTDHACYPTLPAADFERAKAYWKGLGLQTESENPGGAFFNAGQGRFLVFPTSGTPSGTHTQMSFQVTDLRAEVKALHDQGVTFESYDNEHLKTDADGIAAAGPNQAAWFKDSEGNTVGVFQLG